ncbi:signal transduction histidine kinase [Janthinobacterium sp. CG_23.3]|uniref:sensor histidine kinase n=1 Tax=Janthinobacterium sp. CG_23.3 TaxID=3349634 RepID=UPI0038D39C11
MKLYDFIGEHMEAILAEWEAFARTLDPATNHMSAVALRDHARQILQTIALDINTTQNSAQQFEKSQGMADDDADSDEHSAASIHGALRQASHFSLLQLSAEFRALRATVLRLWLPQVRTMSAGRVDEMVRFNEAIDQALAESIVTYSARAEQTRDLFLAVLGHDLRAPLSTMSLAGQLLLRPDTPPEKVLQIAARVKRSAHLMVSMVDDLLGYTRTQLGSGMPMVLLHADLGNICQSAIEDAKAVHPACEFELSAAGRLGGAFDSVRLHQLCTNLFVNAAQYGAKGRPVLVDVRGEGEQVVLRVTNFGAVIAQASLQAIFQPLIQLEADEEQDARPRTSLGLGLFVAREIALAHGGGIAATSSEAEGTVFTVRLPRGAAPA